MGTVCTISTLDELEVRFRRRVHPCPSMPAVNGESGLDSYVGYPTLSDPIVAERHVQYIRPMAEVCT